MSRRHRAHKREIEKDPLYSSLTLAKFINKVMMAGKKSLSRRIVYHAMDNLAKKLGVTDPLEAFETAIENAKPSVEVKSKRVGGATYQVPIEVPPARRISLAYKWIINFSRAKPGRSMEEGLASELADCYKNQGSTIKKRDETHRMAEANKAYAHYR